jgi:hypothetical protein
MAGTVVRRVSFPEILRALDEVPQGGLDEGVRP